MAADSGIPDSLRSVLATACDEIQTLNVVPVDMDRFRPRSLDGWLTLDGKVAYRLAADLVAALTATNLTNTGSNKLVKVLPFPFDYQGEGRRYHVALKLSY